MIKQINKGEKMKSFKVLFTILLLMILIPAPHSYALSKKMSVSYISTIDGDTVRVNNSRTSFTLRLLLIDAPEIATSSKAGQPYSKEAKIYLTKYLQDKKLTIAYDNENKKDKYGRHLVYLYANDVLVNNVIVKNGYAHVGYIMSQTYYLNTLKKSERNAKAQKLRIWSKAGYVNTKGEGFVTPASTAKPNTSKASYPSSKYKNGAPKHLKNCTEVKNYYPYGITVHHISYLTKHDRDNDKLGCEATGIKYESWMKYN